MRANKGFLQLRRLEAARDIATLLASSGNRVMLDSQSLLLNGKWLSPAVPAVDLSFIISCGRRFQGCSSSEEVKNVSLLPSIQPNLCCLTRNVLRSALVPHVRNAIRPALSNRTLVSFTPGRRIFSTFSSLIS